MGRRILFRYFDAEVAPARSGHALIRHAHDHLSARIANARGRCERVAHELLGDESHRDAFKDRAVEFDSAWHADDADIAGGEPGEPLRDLVGAELAVAV